jgi:arsenate reductase-like glutaredoxin family protein
VYVANAIVTSKDQTTTEMSDKGMETPGSSTKTMINSSDTFIKTESDELDKSLDEMLSDIMDEQSPVKSNVISNATSNVTSKSSKSKTSEEPKPEPVRSPPEISSGGSFEDNTFEDDFDVEVLSSIPSDFNADDHLFHMNLLRNVIENMPFLQKK